MHINHNDSLLSQLVMPFAQDLTLQARKLIPLLSISYLLVLGLLVFVALFAAHYSIPVEKFTRDTAVILDGHPFTGVISNIGVLFWCSTLAVCLFASAIHFTRGNTEGSIFLFFSGLITALLLFDDFFMFHDEIFPRYFHISEKVTYAGYLVLVAAYLLKFKEQIFRTDYALLLLAFGFFASSILSDVVLPQEGIVFLVEDGFKLFGIVSWFIYFTRTCFIQVQPRRGETRV